MKHIINKILRLHRDDKNINKWLENKGMFRILLLDLKFTYINIFFISICRIMHTYTFPHKS